MRRFQVPEQNIVVQRGRVFGRESIHVFLCEKEMTEIKQVEIAAKELARHLIVQRMMSVVTFLEEPSDGHADLLRIRLRQKRLRRQRDDEQPGQNGS